MTRKPLTTFFYGESDPVGFEAYVRALLRETFHDDTFFNIQWGPDTVHGSTLVTILPIPPTIARMPQHVEFMPDWRGATNDVVAG